MNTQTQEDADFDYPIHFLKANRESLNEASREILEAVWKHYFETGESLSFRVLPKIIGKQSVPEYMEFLKIYISQDWNNQGDRAIKLNVLGALITKQGSKLAGLLVQLLDLVREQYESDYEIKEIHSSLLKEKKGFSNEQLTTMYRLIQLYGLYQLPISLNSPYSPLDWKVSIPDRVVEFLAFKSSQDCLSKALQEFLKHQLSEKSPSPSTMDFLNTLNAQNERYSPPFSSLFVSEARLNELKKIDHPDFDCTRLIAMCEELNDCGQRNNVHAVAMLIRAILDHVPPIFNCETFKHVVANHGSKSFKGSARRLQEHMRSVGDKFLHVQIRDREVIPDMHEVNCSLELESLLSEICRHLKHRPNAVKE